MSMPATRHPPPATAKLVPPLLKWFSTHARDLPWRRTRDPYAVWVSEIMLQQTQVKTVIPYWERWLRQLPTLAHLAKARPAKIHKLWEGLGYYTRVRNLQKAAQQIMTQHGGRVPEDFDAVLALPGIGRYTAGAICSIAFNQPKPILDGNVIRVLTRLFGIRQPPRERKTEAHLWQLAEELVLHASRRTLLASPCSQLNQGLMELGALVCTPRSPDCPACPVRKFCVAFHQNWQEQLPKPGRRAAAVHRRFIAYVVERAGKFLVRQRAAGSVNAHLWEFPNVEISAAPRAGRRVARRASALPGDRMPALPGVKLLASEPLCTIKHTITRYRITLEAWRAKLTGPSAEVSGCWKTPGRLRRLAFASAHKKVLARLVRERRSPTRRDPGP